MDAAALYRQTGGNPFFVTEVLANSGGGIPATIRDAVMARAARLSAPAYAVLEAAAVIGQRIEPWLLEQLIGQDGQAVEECMAAGMILSQTNLLSFRHELARQIIHEAIDPYTQANAASGGTGYTGFIACRRQRPGSSGTPC